MSRRDCLAVLAVLLSAAGLILVGCSSRSSSESQPSSKPLAVASGSVRSSAGVAPPPTGANERLFQDWPQPVGAIILSGEQRGYLEPCGCTAGQRGGLARRLDLVQRLRAQGWPLVLADLGSLSNDPNSMGGPEETSLRFGIALRALELMEYDAVALSPDDLKLGVGEYITRLLNHPGSKLKVVSANVIPDNALGLQDRLVPVVRTQAGEIKVGITAVVARESFDALNDPEKNTLLGFQTPEDVLPDLLADLERDTHMQILMVQGPPETARGLAKSHPGFEVVLATSPFVDPPKDAELLNNGKTQLITVGRKGQYVGVLGLYQDPKQKFRYRRIELNSRYNNKTEAMRKLIDEDFQMDLKQAGVLESFPRRPYVFTDGPTDAPYVGAETCKSCHPNTYAKWASTDHAKAYQALSKDPKRNREFDAQCVTCHSTGFEYVGGFVSAEQTPHLKGNQCENCHGPGGSHAADPTNAVLTKAMHRDANDFNNNHRCVKCHSEDDSPEFNFGVYWPKIVHKGLDSYTDPRVRVGIKQEKIAR